MHCCKGLCCLPACLPAVQAEHHAATAAQLGGDALVDQCHKLQADLMTCQQVNTGQAALLAVLLWAFDGVCGSRGCDQNDYLHCFTAAMRNAFTYNR